MLFVKNNTFKYHQHSVIIFVKVHESNRNRCETLAVLAKGLDKTKTRHYSYIRNIGQSDGREK